MNKKMGHLFLAFLPAFVCLTTQVFVSVLWQEAMNFGWVHNPSGSVLAYQILGLIVFGLWYYLDLSKDTVSEEKHTFKVKTVVRMAVVSVTGGMIMCFLGNGLLGMEQFIFPGLFQDYVEMMENAGMGVNLYAIAASVLFAPLGEELLCRGITLNYAQKAFSHFAVANILQAFLFALIHLNFIQGLYAFAIGLFLGFLRYRYDSLIPCMLLHFTVNFSSVFFFDRILSVFPNTLVSYTLMFLLALAATGLLMAVSKNKKQ